VEEPVFGRRDCRLASEDWKDAGGTIYAFSYDYDLGRMADHSPWQNGGAVLQRTAAAVRGNRTYASILGEDTYYSYDNADAVLTKTDDAGTTYFSYDPDGNLEMIAEPGGAVTYFEHGSHGLVTKIKPLGGTEVEFGYDALLRRVRMTEGATTTYFRHDGGLAMKERRFEFVVD